MASLPYSSRERDEAVDLIESDRSEAAGSSNAVSLSVVVVLNGPKVMYPVRQLYEDYDRHVQSHVESYEIIFVVDGDFPIESEDVEYLRSCGRHVTILRFAKRFGYAACLSAGFERVAGDVILTLPSYHQVAPERLPLLIGALDNFDMVVARRWPRIDSWLNRAQTFVFNSLIKALGFEFNDLTCAVRVLRRSVIEEVQVYGDQHRFLPVLASHQGFSVKEVDLPQSDKDTLRSNFRPDVYIRRLLDLLSIFFLVKFTKKPLRFFGLPGLLVSGVGFLFTAFLAIQRLYMGVDLADRPALLLGLLLIVLGFQFFAIGLIGELVIFIHARNLRGYRVERIIQGVNRHD